MIKKFVGCILILTLLLQFVLPIQASAVTLGEYEAKVAEYKKQAYENESKINMTKEEIAAARRQIEKLKSEVVSLSQEISKLNEEIDDYNQKINDKLVESKQILEYAQLSRGENAYLEYIFNASSTAELIYRSALVQELVDYNNRAIDEMQAMVNDNKERQKRIEERKVEINKREEELVGRVASLGQEKESLDEIGASTELQIKAYEEKVAHYKKIGCKSNDVIGVDCAVDRDAGIFRRPTKTGYITQEAYYSNNYTHRALDIGSKNRKSEKIYPVADGKIVYLGPEGWGALTVGIEHYVADKNIWYSSMYVHLSSFAPNLEIGDYVTSDQYIGYMGDTGKASGVHLHLEIFPCRLNDPYDPNCSDLGSFIQYGKRMMSQGYKGPRSLINFPKGLYNSWNSR